MTKRILALVLCLLMVAGITVTAGFADEAPEAIELSLDAEPTAAPEPTAEPDPEPTPEPTPEATATPTVTPTEAPAIIEIPLPAGEDEEEPIEIAIDGEGEEVYVASITRGETVLKYTTLAEAVSNAQAGDTVVLLADVNALPTINKAITIDGNGHNVAGTAGENQFGTIDGTVTLKNIVFTNGNEAIRTDYLSADYSKLTLVIDTCTFNNLTTYAIMGGSAGYNHVLGALTVNGCNFVASNASFTGNYMLYAQCVKNVSVTNSIFDGNSSFRGAIHLGDSTEHATTATISNNTIKNICRGVQIGNRKANTTIFIDDNTFVGINYNEQDTNKSAIECVPIFIHANADAATTKVSVTNNNFNSLQNDYIIYNEDPEASAASFVTTFTGNKENGAEVELADNYFDSYFEPVAKVGNVGYASLAAAVEAANIAGETATITLLQDVTLTERLTISGNVTFDGGAYKLSGCSYVSVTGKLSIIGGKFDADVTYYCVDGKYSKASGDEYVVADAPGLPTAKVTALNTDELGVNLTFALNFIAEEPTHEQLACYGNWYADFVLTVNKKVTFNANGESDGYLAGQYDAFGNSWLIVPDENVTLEAGQSIKIMKTAAEMYSSNDLRFSYGAVWEIVQDFDCGVYFTDEFLQANPDFEVTLELQLINPVDESITKTVGEVYTYKASDLVETTVSLSLGEGADDGQTYLYTITNSQNQTMTVAVPPAGTTVELPFDTYSISLNNKWHWRNGEGTQQVTIKDASATVTLDVPDTEKTGWFSHIAYSN